VCDRNVFFDEPHINMIETIGDRLKHTIGVSRKSYTCPTFWDRGVKKGKVRLDLLFAFHHCPVTFTKSAFGAKSAASASTSCRFQASAKPLTVLRTAAFWSLSAAKLLASGDMNTTKRNTSEIEK
jgi:hypothetical protein